MYLNLIQNIRYTANVWVNLSVRKSKWLSPYTFVCTPLKNLPYLFGFTVENRLFTLFDIIQGDTDFYNK